MIFTTRTTAPSSTNKYYLKYVDSSKYGYNKCIEINSSTHSCLPNCVGYAYGRFMECQGVTSCNLSRGNAGTWYLYIADGYQRGQTPKLGAVVCYSKRGGAGHVAFVEKVYPNGDIDTTNSAYNGTRFYKRKLLAHKRYYYGSGYEFQGFIYNPTEFTPYVPPTPTETKKENFKWVLYANKLRQKRI